MDELDMLVSTGIAPDADLSPVDVDGDGVTDWHSLSADPGVEVYDLGGGTASVDVDGDGDWEALATDQDGDGQAEVTLRDGDGDGSLETVDVALPGALSFGPEAQAFQVPT